MIISSFSEILQIAIYLPAVTFKQLPMIIMSVVALVGSVLSLFLPETLGAPFVENVEDVKELKASSKPFFAVWSAATLQRHLEANIRRKAEIAQG